VNLRSVERQKKESEKTTRKATEMKEQLRKSKNSEGKKREGKERKGMKSNRANLGSIEQKCCYRQSTRIKGSEEKAAALCAAKQTQFQADRDSLKSAKTTPSNNHHCTKCS